MLPGQTNYFHSVSELQQEQQQQQQATPLCHTRNGSSSSNKHADCLFKQTFG